MPTADKADDGTRSDGAAEPRDERRAHQRIPVMLEVDYRAAETFLFAYITDISAMGIFVRTPHPEEPGTHLFLRFTPPGNEAPLEFEGEVIWINPPRDEDDELSARRRSPGMGIQFSALLPEQRERILELVRTFAYLDDIKPENCQ